jgi:hypothetical protein
MPRAIADTSGIDQRLAQHKGEIQRLIEEKETANATERKKLNDRIEELENKIAADKKAREDAEKAQGTGGTLVLPPEQVPQGQHHGDEHANRSTTRSDAESGAERKRTWKHAW